MAQIFISYKRIDKEKVLSFADRIQEELHVSYWMDVEEIKSDAQFASEIINAIDESEIFLFMYSKSHTTINNYKTDWTIRELNYAQEQNKRIVFVNIDGTAFTKWFTFMFPQKQQVNAQSKFELDKLFRDLSTWLRNRQETHDHIEVHPRVSHSTCICEYDSTFNNSQSSKLFTVLGVMFSMIKVEKGIFFMGTVSPFSETTQIVIPEMDNSHYAVLSKDYYLGETPVTQNLWRIVMNENPSRFVNDDNPVDSVSWSDCQHFIERLNKITGMNFRLPTETEWEFAARGGNRSKCYRYSGSNNIETVAWHLNNSLNQTHPVKQKKANELGLYDMSGNIWEWCYDYYDDYEGETQYDPIGPNDGSHHVYRGGCWCETDDCRVTARRAGTADFTSYGGLGLRLALSF